MSVGVIPEVGVINALRLKKKKKTSVSASGGQIKFSI